MHQADIDIDFGNRDNILEVIKTIPAKLESGRKHNSGVYIQPIPTDPMSGLASIDHKAADNRGYFKLDLLNVKIYDLIESPEQYEELMEAEIPWEKLDNKKFVKQLLHISDYYDLLQGMKVDSIPRLAMFIAVIRPGKKHLQNKEWKEVAETIWDETDKGFIFKKSHSIAYAMLVALHMRILNLPDKGN